MTASNAPTTFRKARVRVTRALGSACPVGYREGESMTVDLNSPEEAFRCPGVQRAIEPFLDAARKSSAPEPLEFVASCECPHSHSEVVFSLHMSPPLHGAGKS
jgi:uncharacterized repeat protein (TIGR04076 family)